jgi:dethiobiotin synthetase
MTARFVVTGTDTGVGKTVFSAALAGAIDGVYWKPVQAGLDGPSDSELVRRLSGLPNERVLAEAYRLRLPASPHIAAAHEQIEIKAEALSPPHTARPLVIEGAGGLLVPLSRRLLQIDLFTAWGVPIILCARTALGTINHTLLSLEALRRRGARVLGVAFVGAEAPEVEHTIVEMGGARRLGRLPWITPLTSARLSAAFRLGFRLCDFLH